MSGYKSDQEYKIIIDQAAKALVESEMFDSEVEARTYFIRKMKKTLQAA